MTQKINYTKVWTIIAFLFLFFALFTQCENNSQLADKLEQKAIEAEKNSEMYEARNNHLIETQLGLSDTIKNLRKNSKVISKKIIEVKTKVVYVKDTTTAKRYITERYGDSTINMVNDLIKYDVCKQEVKLLNQHIENKDSIITYQSKRIEVDSIAYSNIDNALKELKTANEINKDLFENSQKELRKKKRENIFVKIGLFALSIFAVVK
jgi:hypothetical protein